MKLIRYLIILSLGCYALPALADQTVTFNVPVHLANLHPQVAKVSIQCTVTPTPAHGRTDLPVTNRAFDGTVQVDVVVNDNDAVVASGYQCEFYLFPQSGSGWTPSQSAAAKPQEQAQAGTPFTRVVQGSLDAVQVQSPPGRLLRERMMPLKLQGK